MRTKRIMIGTGALAMGLLVLNLMSSPVYGQTRNADTQAMAGFTFGLLSPRLLNALNSDTGAGNEDRSTEESSYGSQ